MPTSTQVPSVEPVAARSSRNRRAISFRTTMLWLLYFASSSPAAGTEAPGGKPMGSVPVASMPEWYSRAQSHSRWTALCFGPAKW